MQDNLNDNAEKASKKYQQDIEDYKQEYTKTIEELVDNINLMLEEKKE